MLNEIIDLIISYENRITVAEELITNSYKTTTTFDTTLEGLTKERENLSARLEELSAKNCSLRKKDFRTLIQRVLSESEEHRRTIEEMRQQVREELKEYCDDNRQLAASLHQNILKFNQGKTDISSIKEIINNIKTTYQYRRQQVSDLLCNFQREIELFLSNQRKINQKLQRVLDRGESLKIEDLRQLESEKNRQERKAEMQARREEIGALLTRFKEKRRTKDF